MAWMYKCIHDCIPFHINELKFEVLHGNGGGGVGEIP